MAKFFGTYPKIKFDLQQNRIRPQYDTITNITFRVNILKDVINLASSYYYYNIKDTDRPEILAYKIYKDVEYHWILLYANDMLDPISDWPKDYNSFNKYIISKYGSIENAKTSNHHYEMVILRENVSEDVITETRFEITQEKLTDNTLTVPFDYYEGTGSLEDTQGVTTFDIDGKTVIETVSRETITNYDYEVKLNDDRRKIKIIKEEYLGQITSEFKKLTGAKNRYLREF